MLGIKKSRTMPYHHQGDSQPERFHMMLDMLGTLDVKKKVKWSQHIGQLVHCYNCTQNEPTGFSPCYLMFGREARLPVDLFFGTSSGDTSQKVYHNYVSDMKKNSRRLMS